jgi:hypothetical protein
MVLTLFGMVLTLFGMVLTLFGILTDGLDRESEEEKCYNHQ